MIFIQFAEKVKTIVVNIRDNLFFYKKSYSQEGEDLVLARYFGNKKNGFYVDVGANHPKRFSNTYYFYKRGWSGINIDPLPKSKELFDKFRKRDINLNMGVFNEKRKLNYYMFEESQLNTFSERVKSDRLKKGKKLISIRSIELDTLASILDKYCKGKIDFFSIDTEGFDLKVLKSNNWKKYSPKLIIVELINGGDLFRDKIYLFLKKKGYSFYAKTGNSVIFEGVD